jgi:hypothetical protein
MIYIGLDFPGAGRAINYVKKTIEQPKQTAQVLLLTAGTLILVNRANR